MTGSTDILLSVRDLQVEFGAATAAVRAVDRCCSWWPRRRAALLGVKSFLTGRTCLVCLNFKCVMCVVIALV